jgi:DNA-directed RNA polymerase specialized sigma24 family protein
MESLTHTLGQLSHRELIRLLVANPHHRPVLQEFISRYNSTIRQTVAGAISKRKAALGYETIQLLIDDAVNETYCRLFQHNCRALRTFHCRYTNSIFAYLRTICLNVVRNQMRDHLRKRPKGQLQSIDEIEEKGGGQLFERSEASLNLAAVATDSAEIRILEQFIRTRLGQVFRPDLVNRNFIIFKLHFRYGYYCHEIARIKALGLGESGVGNTADRIRQWLCQIIPSC